MLNITAIYNTLTQKVIMVALNVANLTDAAWNPPDCVQIPIDIESYQTFQNNEDAYTFIYNCCQQIEGGTE